MDLNPKLKEYSEEMPPEVKNLLKGLSNDDRLGILLALMKTGKMTFKEMKEKFGLHSSSLSNHLTALQDGNLVENFYEKRDEKGFSYYDVTDVPEAVLDALFKILYETTPDVEEHPVDTEIIVEKESETVTSPSINDSRKNWERLANAGLYQRRRVTTVRSSDSEYSENLGAGSI